MLVRVVLHGHETWSLTLREEYRLWVFEDKVLKRIENLRRRKCRRLGKTE
jgi:hypothetical protein